MSNCGCVYNDYDHETVSVFEQGVVRARKDHRCHVCCSKIARGEKYERIKGSLDGLFTVKTCLDCLSIRNEFFCEGGCYEFLEDLEEHLRSIQGQVKSECLKGLTPAARARVIDMIDKIWEE